MRTLAIDYGEARCGLAWTDPLGMFATALPGCLRTELDGRLQQHVLQGPVSRIVVGFPTRLDGTDTHVTNAVRTYAQQLLQRYPAVAVYLFDERLTSQRAQQTLHEAGLNRTKRQDKQLIDSVSAVILLQDFLAAPVPPSPLARS